MPHEQIIPIGMSGNCVELIETLTALHHVPAILDDAEAHRDTCFQGIPILPLDHAAQFADARFVFLIGSERSFRLRRRIIDGLGVPRDAFPPFLHPRARVSRMASIGRGCVLYDDVLVTSDARIGEFVMILPRTIVHHGARIGNHGVIGSGVILAGDVRVGDSVFIGSGSALRNGVSVGDGAIVGLGSVVVADVPSGSVVAGNPARPIGPSRG